MKGGGGYHSLPLASVRLGFLSVGFGAALWAGEKAVVVSVGAGIVRSSILVTGHEWRMVYLRRDLVQRLSLRILRGVDMSVRKIQKPWSMLLMVIVMILPMSVAFAPASHAEGECGFGLYVTGYDDNDAAICENTLWKIINNNDGFDRVVEGSVGVDNSDTENNSYDFRLYVRCTSKKLEVFAASTFDLFYESAYKSGGSIQVKFDSGKIAKYKFTKSTSNKGLFLNNPKTFSTALSKAKSKVALKFSSSRGIIVLHFPVSDFAQNKKTFSTAGCKL
jgi:hypothetical protein